MIDTKSQILSNALNLFAKNSYEKTTMRNIAKEAGITSGGIYYFFKSKEDILNTILAEFEEDFRKCRCEPEDIFKAAESKPLSEVLRMLFYTAGSTAERGRILNITRIILSLQYENASAKEIYQKMVEDAVNHRIKIFNGLYAMGKIKETNFEWVAYIFHSYGFTMMQENIMYMESPEEGKKDHAEGIKFFCSAFAEIIGKLS